MEERNKNEMGVPNMDCLRTEKMWFEVYDLKGSYPCNRRLYRLQIFENTILGMWWNEVYVSDTWVMCDCQASINIFSYSVGWFFGRVYQSIVLRIIRQ